MPPPPQLPSASISPVKSRPSSSYHCSPTKQRMHSHTNHGHWTVAATATEPQQLQRDTSDVSADGRDKSVVWDSLWSLDVSYPGK